MPAKKEQGAHVETRPATTQLPERYDAFIDCGCPDGQPRHKGHYAGTFKTEDEARRRAHLERAHCSTPGNHAPHGRGEKRCSGYRYPAEPTAALLSKRQ